MGYYLMTVSIKSRTVKGNKMKRSKDLFFPKIDCRTQIQARRRTRGGADRLRHYNMLVVG